MRPEFLTLGTRVGVGGSGGFHSECTFHSPPHACLIRASGDGVSAAALTMHSLGHSMEPAQGPVFASH